MIRIAVTGPESTGKSQLSEALGIHFGAVVVPEYARSYLDVLARPYTREDVLAIARGQERMIHDAISSETAEVVVADTELLVISIWLSHKYGRSDPWVEDALKRQPFDLYLLCDVDLPWEEDPLREHPHLRSYFFGQYEQRLKELGVTYGIVRGLGEARLDCALECIHNTLLL